MARIPGRWLAGRSLSDSGQVTDGGGTQTFTIGSGGTLTLTSTTVNWPSFETTVVDATSTVQYSAAGTQTIEGTSFGSYGHLVLSGSGLKQVENGSDLDVAGNLTIGAGTTLDADTNAEDVDINGNLINHGSFDGDDQTFTFSGPGAQTVSGSSVTTVENVVFDNGVDSVILSGIDFNVGGTLELNDTVVTTGPNKLNKTSTGIPTRGSGYVNGALQRALSGSGFYGFHVGTSSAFTEVDINASAASGALLVRATAGEHPQLGSGINAARNLNTYFSVAIASGTVTFSSTTTFNYPSSNIDAGSTASAFAVRRWNGSAWSAVTVSGTPTTTQTLVSGMTVGDFVIGNLGQSITVTTPAPASASYGSSFVVAATASSGLPVSYSSSGSCSNVSATFTMTSSVGSCTVTYSQPGNAIVPAAPNMTNVVAAAKATLAINALDDDKIYGQAASGLRLRSVRLRLRPERHQRRGDRRRSLRSAQQRRARRALCGRPELRAG